MFNTADNVDFIKEVRCSVSVIVKKPLDCNFSSICQNSLHLRYTLMLTKKFSETSNFCYENGSFYIYILLLHQIKILVLAYLINCPKTSLPKLVGFVKRTRGFLNCWVFEVQATVMKSLHQFIHFVWTWECTEQGNTPNYHCDYKIHIQVKKYYLTSFRTQYHFMASKPQCYYPNIRIQNLWFEIKCKNSHLFSSFVISCASKCKLQ